MKKLGYILGGFVLFIIILSVILGQMAEAHDGPTQNCSFRNSSKEERSITFEYVGEDGKKYRTLDLKLKPGEEKIERLPAHKYIVEVWDSKDKLAWEIKEYNVTLPNNETDLNLKYMDLADSMAYAVVTLNFVYEGNSFAESMSSAAGTNQKSMYLKDTYDANTLFKIGDTYTRATLVDFYKGKKLPEKIKSREFVYGLIPVPKAVLDTPEFYDYVQTAIEKGMK